MPKKNNQPTTINQNSIPRESLETMRNHFNECINEYIHNLKYNKKIDEDMETFLIVMLDYYDKAVKIYPPQ